MANIPNQSLFENDQNYEIDIDKIYSDIIKKIDATRSVVNISNQNNQQLLKKINTTNVNNLRQNIRVEPTVQESRCHALYRMIGLPIAGQNNFYNPGFNVKPNKITSDFKLNVLHDLAAGFRKLSNFRESYLFDIATIFSNNTTIDASTLALSSSTSIRSFATASEKFDPESYLDQNDQSYKVDIDSQGLVGYMNYISLNDYMDAQGNKSTKLQKNRYHIIMPLTVDPWIDLTVCPITNLIAVPFILDNSYYKISEVGYVKPPLLDSVIRDRFSENSSDAGGDYTESLKQFIELIPSIKNNNLINSVINNAQLVDQRRFREYLNIIIAMAGKLYEAQHKIKEVQSEYYWLPIPSTTGPEGGVEVRTILSQFSVLTSQAGLATQNDYDLFEAIALNSLALANASINTVNSTPGTNNTSQINTTLLPDTTTAYGDSKIKVLDKLNDRRNQAMTEAGQALRTIEIIMGEFSGLGLCDIIAILGALYVMPKNKILGFLDDDAFDRAKTALKLSETRPNFQDTLNSYTNTVKDFYVLMDKIYIDHIQNNDRA